MNRPKIQIKVWKDDEIQNFRGYWEQQARRDREAHYMKQEGRLLSHLRDMSIEEAHLFLRRRCLARWDFDEATSTFRLYSVFLGQDYEKRYDCGAFSILILGQGHDA